jgi:hypothetical protein
MYLIFVDPVKSVLGNLESPPKPKTKKRELVKTLSPVNDLIGKSAKLSKIEEPKIEEKDIICNTENMWICPLCDEFFDEDISIYTKHFINCNSQSFP